MSLEIVFAVFQFGARRMDWMVARVEDLLEEAPKEGGGAVAEAEVHMGCEVPRGWEQRNCISVSISHEVPKSLFWGGIAKLKICT